MTMTSDTGAQPAPKPAAGARFKTVAVGTAVALVLSLAAYVAGRVQTASRIEDALGRATAADKLREQTNVELAHERAKVSRLEARRRLHLALLALDDRNFGIAQGELSAAAALLARGPSESGSELEKLTRDIVAARLVATEDVAVQRQRLLDWARRFDRLVPPAPAK